MQKLRPVHPLIIQILSLDTCFLCIHLHFILEELRSLSIFQEKNQGCVNLPGKSSYPSVFVRNPGKER